MILPKQFWRTLTVMLIVGAIWYIEAHKAVQLTSSAPDVAIPTIPSSSPISTSLSIATSVPQIDRTALLQKKAFQYSRAKELADIEGYINSEPFTLADIVGKKVILIDFWTYSCINCQRTTPYLNAWYEKYKDKGLVIVGVHTPEFDFEKNYQNVASATKKAGIAYPVVLDSNRGTWSAYNNRFWPRKYLIDIDGYVVYDHIGEGAYDETELKIQELLIERAEVLGERALVAPAITAPSQNDINAGSPETYFGAYRNDALGSGKKNNVGEQFFEEPVNILPNRLYLVGSWNIQGEYAQTSAVVDSPAIGSDRVNYLYTAQRVYLVAHAAQPIDIEVLRDGKPIDPSVKGRDVFYKDGKSYVRIRDAMLYKIIEDSAYGKHLLEFVIEEPGLQLFTFTFG